MPATNVPESTIRATITRVTSGIQFHLQLGQFEAFYRSLSTMRGGSDISTYADRFVVSPTMRFYNFNDRERETLCSLPGCFYEPNTGRVVDNSGAVNLAYLVPVGCGAEEGTTFTVRTVMTNQQCVAFINSIQTLLRNMYLEFMQPVNHVVEFTIREISE